MAEVIAKALIIESTGTDQTAEVEAAVTACPAGGTIWFVPNSAGAFVKIKETITIEKSLTLCGTGMNVEYGSLIAGVFNQQVMPAQAPYLRGSVVEMTAKNKDVFHFTGDGICVNIYDLGIIFAELFKETGHGIVAKYKNASGAWGTVPNNGPQGMNWSNVCVFGHDGNHYAYELINSQLSSFNQLQWFGGGALKWDVSEYEGKFGSPGNSTVTELYGVLCCPGTAHGVSVVETNAPGSTSLTFVRPQIMGLHMTQFAATGAGPNFGTQYAYRDHGKGKNILMFDVDIEGGTGALAPETFKIEGSKTAWLHGFFGAFVEKGTLGTLEIPGTLEALTALKSPAIEATTSLSVGFTALLSIQGKWQFAHGEEELGAGPTVEKLGVTEQPLAFLNATAAVKVQSLEYSGGANQAASVLTLKNVSAFTITFEHESASGTATNRFNFSAGVDFKLAPNQNLVLWNTGTRWVDVATSVKRPAQLPKLIATENKFAFGIPGMMRTQIIAWDAKKEPETKVKHELQTTQIQSVKAYKWTEAANTNLVLQTEVKITSYSIVSKEEIKIKWEAEPAKEEQIGIVLQGL